MYGQERYAEINELLNRKFEEKQMLICAHRGSWHGNLVQNTVPAYKAAFMMGADKGSTTRRKVEITLQPSIWEASSSSWGMVLWKKVRDRIIYHMLVALGRSTAHMVFTRPRLRTTK